MKTVFNVTKEHGFNGLRILLLYYIFRLNNLLKLNKRLFCPCCETFSKYFLPVLMLPLYVRNNARCPNCDSYERHRALFLFYEDHFSKSNNDETITILHYGAEDTLKPFFQSLPNADYKTIYYLKEAEPVATKISYSEYEQVEEINGRQVKIEGDLQKMEFPDNYADYIVHHHVLEHVEDEQKALREMQRVLKPGGKCYISVPMHAPGNLTTFFEQPDSMGHWRHYGDDSVERFESSGFDAEIISLDHDNKTARRYGIMKNERVFTLKKSFKQIL